MEAPGEGLGCGLLGDGCLGLSLPFGIFRGFWVVLGLVEACLFFSLFGLATSMTSSAASSLILLSVGVKFLFREPAACLLDAAFDEAEPPRLRWEGWGTCESFASCLVVERLF